MTGGLVSHVAATLEGRWLLLGVQAVHLLAMASWVGGVLGFATVFWRAGAGSLPAREAARLALAIPAFSGLAVLAVATLALSGLILARLHLAAWDELLGTAYGRWLAAKVVVFLAMLGLGALAPGMDRALALARDPARGRGTRVRAAVPAEHSARGRPGPGGARPGWGPWRHCAAAANVDHAPNPD